MYFRYGTDIYWVLIFGLFLTDLASLLIKRFTCKVGWNLGVSTRLCLNCLWSFLIDATPTWKKCDGLQHVSFLSEVHHHVIHTVAGLCFQGQTKCWSHSYTANTQTRNKHLQSVYKHNKLLTDWEQEHGNVMKENVNEGTINHSMACIYTGTQLGSQTKWKLIKMTIIC